MGSTGIVETTIGIVYFVITLELIVNLDAIKAQTTLGEYLIIVLLALIIVSIAARELTKGMSSLRQTYIKLRGSGV
jgi:hypothetical protein